MVYFIQIFTIFSDSREPCCSGNFTFRVNWTKDCPDIPLDPDDTVYGKINAQCLPVNRSSTNLDNNCSTSFRTAEQVKCCRSNEGM